MTSRLTLCLQLQMCHFGFAITLKKKTQKIKHILLKLFFSFPVSFFHLLQKLPSLPSSLMVSSALNDFKRRATAVLKSKQQFHLSSARQ